MIETIENMGMIETIEMIETIGMYKMTGKFSSICLSLKRRKF